MAYRHDFKFGINKKVHVPDLHAFGIIEKAIWREGVNYYELRVYVESSIVIVELREDEISDEEEL